MKTTATTKKMRESMISPRRKQIPRLGECEFAIADSAEVDTSVVHPTFELLIPPSRAEFSGRGRHILHFQYFFWPSSHPWS